MFAFSPPSQEFLDRRSTLFLAVSLIVLSIAGRFLSMGEWGNFTPVGAAALFAGCFIADRRLAYLIPISAMLISDAILGFHSLMPLVYACFGFSVFLGQKLKPQPSGIRLMQFALLSATSFFLVTNFAVWAFGTMYPHTAAGLLQCFAMAVPFFKNDLVGTLLYSALLFGGLQVWQRHYALRTA